MTSAAALRAVSVSPVATAPAGFPRTPPMVGFFEGLFLGSLLIGLLVTFLTHAEVVPPVLPGLFTTAGAGGGAWLGTLNGHPDWVSTRWSGR